MASDLSALAGLLRTEAGTDGAHSIATKKSGAAAALTPADLARAGDVAATSTFADFVHTHHTPWTVLGRHRSALCACLPLLLLCCCVVVALGRSGRDEVCSQVKREGHLGRGGRS